MPIDVVFYFDFTSPWAYLADLRIDDALAGTDARVVRVPVYLRGFEMFRSGVPYASEKLVYIGRDLARHAERFGVPLRFPHRFPIDALRALRAMVHLEGTPHADAFRKAAFAAAWAEDRDLASSEVVLDVAESVGASRAEVLAALGDPTVKARLRDNTDRAIARGAFGVPTFFIGDEMFWGQDRIDFVRWAVDKALHTANPSSGAAVASAKAAR
jgi:2-hydroxychromene-2-carboxylate isomerase